MLVILVIVPLLSNEKSFSNSLKANSAKLRLYNHTIYAVVILFFLREIRMSFEIIAVIISLSINIYIHYETEIYPFTRSLKSVSLNKSVVYYTTHTALGSVTNWIL